MSRAADILAYIDNDFVGEEVEIEIDEVTRKRQVVYRTTGGNRPGKRKIRYTCQPGHRLVGKRCVRMKAQERRQRSRSQIKRHRRLRGKQRMINRRRARTMQRRKRAGY